MPPCPAEQQHQQEQANRPPTVASAIGDLSDLTAGDTGDVSVSGVFSDLDGDALTITAGSADDAVATVVVSADQSTLSGSAARYDANGDGAIDGSEYQQVKNDWLSGKINYDEFLEVVRVHLNSG